MVEYAASQFNRNFKTGGISASWWKEDRAKVHEALGPLIDELRDEQRERDNHNHEFLQMFFGHHTSGLKGNRYAVGTVKDSRFAVNVARTIASAANSKLAKDKIRVLYLTEGGDYAAQVRGKRMTKVINGTFYSSQFHEENARAQLDSCVFDVGAVYFWTEDKKLRCVRVPGHEIRVDALDARYGTPTQLFREMVVPRAKLYARYPGKKADIDTAPLSDEVVQAGGNYISDCVNIVMAWHLPSAPGEKDGRFAVVLPNATLETDIYKHDFFPFVFHIWEAQPVGFYGQSVCAQLWGLQYNIKKMVSDIQEHADLSTGFVAIESGSIFTKQALTNEIWRTCEYSGAPPQYIVPPSFQGDKVDWLRFLIQRCHDETGMSELSVTARKPDGLDSGKALREYADQNSERFQMTQQRWQQTHVDAAKVIAALYEDIYQREGAFKVPAFGQKEVEMIDWEKARMDEENYTVRPVPTSFLPSTPSAKLQTVQEMLQSGLLTLEEGKRLLDYPDLEHINNMQLAPMINIEKKIERMLDPDDPQPQDPDPLNDLQTTAKMALAAYNQAEVQGAPEENLTLLRNFISATNDMLEAAMAPPPAPPEAMPPEAMGQPMPGGPMPPPQAPPMGPAGPPMIQ